MRSFVRSSTRHDVPELWSTRGCGVWSLDHVCRRSLYIAVATLVLTMWCLGTVSHAGETTTPTSIEVTDTEGPIVWFHEERVWGKLRKRVDTDVWIVAETAPPGGTFQLVRMVQKQRPRGRVTTTTTVQQVTTDPYGFTNWLNATRAAYGLAPVGYDPNLTSWAHVNNTHQSVRGMGHYVMGAARRQNSAMGHYASVPGMWMASPAHRAALLDPSIRWIGIAGLGAYWTFDAR